MKESSRSSRPPREDCWRYISVLYIVTKTPRLRACWKVNLKIPPNLPFNLERVRRCGEKRVVRSWTEEEGHDEGMGEPDFDSIHDS